MNAILAAPLELRLAVLVALGLAAGSGINWAIYALAWFPRPISPWQKPAPTAPPRHFVDFLPVAGWLGLRREASIHGTGFWVRPLLIELICGVGLAALYWWEISGHLLPRIAGIALPPALPLQPMLHQQFAAHAVLFGLMLVATFIDFDEKTIPDEITIPGAIVGLLLAALWPLSHLPVAVPGPLGAPTIGNLLLTSSNQWPEWLNTWRGLVLGAGGFVAWCLVLIPALCTLRRGWKKAFQFYFATLFRGSAWWKMLLLAAIGSGTIAAVWGRGDASWRALMTAITGMLFGGGLIWAVRIVGTVALRKEAMGFGDVTLMAMIGAFLGWQASLIVFFLSPFAALVVSVAQWLFTGRRDIAFGPYLCLAALVVVVKWNDIWHGFAGPIFAMGWLVPALVGVCLMLMMGLLMLWRMGEQWLFGPPKD